LQLPEDIDNADNDSGATPAPCLWGMPPAYKVFFNCARRPYFGHWDAVDTLVKHFASALGERGIRVNAVAPGVVETGMSNFARTDAGRDYTLGMQALKRIAQPGDISGAVVFLASDEARWITGDTLRVDGGSKL
jgi:NAD(P)-dependent dehydrogenase (short-subunit alcohol dehydrogenase family)